MRAADAHQMLMIRQRCRCLAKSQGCAASPTSYPPTGGKEDALACMPHEIASSGAPVSPESVMFHCGSSDVQLRLMLMRPPADAPPAL